MSQQEDDHPVHLSDRLDHDKLAEAALAILSLSLHDHGRVWKGLDWDVLNLLYKKGWISDPIGKAKSVSLTQAGLEVAEDFLLKHFEK
jgi:hypothetical protein